MGDGEKSSSYGTRAVDATATIDRRGPDEARRRQDKSPDGLETRKRMTPSRRTSAGRWLLCLALLVASAAPAWADYPDKTVRVIVGPGPDLLARILAQHLKDEWGQAVIVDPRPAAGGIIAIEGVVKAPADGYTLLLSSGSYTINSLLHPEQPFNLPRDLAPISLMATLPFLLIVPATSPYHALKDVLDAARAQPGKLTYATPGVGTPAHLAGEMLKQMAHVDITHVPYKGAPAGVTDVVGGQVTMMFVPAPSALPLVKDGKVRAIAVTTPKRYGELPNVQTVAEQGYPDYTVVGWNGLHTRAGTPKDVVEKIDRAVQKILKSPDAQMQIRQAGFEVVGSSVQDFDKFVKAELARYADVIKKSGMKAAD
jgi:tripartite-type tricarboxylate transporter receptor subunit TctC